MTTERTESVLGPVPDSWTIKRLEEVSDFITKGGTPTTYGFDWASQKDGIPFFRSECVTDNGFNPKGMNYIHEQAHQQMSRSEIEPGDLLMTITGNIGRVAVAPSEFESANINQHIARIRILDDAGANASFVYHCLKHDGYATHYRAILTGQAYPQISLQQVRETPVALPPLPEQQKIAAILTAVDDKLDMIARQIEATQTLKQGLMQTLFSRGVGTQDADGRWVPHAEFKDSELGEIPAAWNVAEIQSIAEVIRGASPRPQGDPRYYGGDVPRLMGADVTRDGKWVTPQIDFLTQEGAKRSRPCPKGTLTIICSGDVGIPSFLAVDACIHDGFLALINIDEASASKNYLYHVISSLKQRLDASATHGGVFTNLTTTILKEFRLPLPSIAEQEKIAAALDAVDDKLAVAVKRHQRFQTLKRGLMQKLLTGEWRVSVDSSAPGT